MIWFWRWMIQACGRIGFYSVMGPGRNDCWRIAPRQPRADMRPRIRRCRNWHRGWGGEGVCIARAVSIERHREKQSGIGHRAEFLRGGWANCGRPEQYETVLDAG